MSESINNTPEKKKKKKILLLLLLLLLVFVMVTGILAAFFSDYIFRRTDLTAGTLKIEGVYSFFLNGETATDTVTDFKPGDAMVVRVNVTNTGNISAWIREVVTLIPQDNAILPHIQVYAGEYTQEQLTIGGLNGNLLNLDENGVAASESKVINGSDGGGETETGGGYTYIGSNTYQTAYTVYFLPTATNEAQGLSLGLNVATQAIQFENNTTDPNNIPWDTVVAAV